MDRVSHRILSGGGKGFFYAKKIGYNEPHTSEYCIPALQ